MRTFFGIVAVVAASAAVGCKKKVPEVVEPTHQNTVETALQIVAVSPSTVAEQRQTSAVLVGSGFTTGALASIGGNAVQTNFRNSNQLDIAVPALAAGVYDVSVTLPDTSEATLPAGLSVRGSGGTGGVSGSVVDSCRKVVLYFDTNSASVPAESRQLVQSLVPCFNSTSISMQVHGHADERDTTDYNLALGQRRAQAVANLLAEVGVSRGRIVTTSFGEERPAVQGSDDVSLSKNRRVEILVD